MSLYLCLPLLLATTGLGWVAGMWTKDRTSRWCAKCGTVLTCRTCSQAGSHRLDTRGGSSSQRRLFAAGGAA